MDPNRILSLFKEYGIRRGVGVPDSTLNVFIDALSRDSEFHCTIATNECEAVSIAMGQYLGSVQPSLVYMQNSGFGKTIHPLTSLLAKDICRIPALLMIGWRGDPSQKKDEPQHHLMGQIMGQLLADIQVEYEILSEEAAESQVKKAVEWMRTERRPFALIVRPGYFRDNLKRDSLQASSNFELDRSSVVRLVYESCAPGAVVVATTGKISRELYALHKKTKKNVLPFYTVGGMGCASSIALGITHVQPSRPVVVLDGDGAALMQLGSLVQLGKQNPSNLVHVLLDNEAHDSTGGQPTLSKDFDFSQLARLAGYESVCRVETGDALKAALADSGQGFLHVKCRTGDKVPLGRPEETPLENVLALQRGLELL